MGAKLQSALSNKSEVVQEIYGWLGHYAVRCLMFTAAQQAGISPLRLGFTGTLKVMRRAIPEFQDIQPEQLPFFSPSASHGHLINPAIEEPTD